MLRCIVVCSFFLVCTAITHVAVVGEAGAGKSRLVNELLHSMGKRGRAEVGPWLPEKTVILTRRRPWWLFFTFSSAPPTRHNIPLFAITLDETEATVTLGIGECLSFTHSECSFFKLENRILTAGNVCMTANFTSHPMRVNDGVVDVSGCGAFSVHSHLPVASRANSYLIGITEEQFEAPSDPVDPAFICSDIVLTEGATILTHPGKTREDKRAYLTKHCRGVKTPASPFTSTPHEYCAGEICYVDTPGMPVSCLAEEGGCESDESCHECQRNADEAMDTIVLGEDRGVGVPPRVGHVVVVSAVNSTEYYAKRYAAVGVKLYYVRPEESFNAVPLNIAIQRAAAAAEPRVSAGSHSAGQEPLSLRGLAVQGALLSGVAAVCAFAAILAIRLLNTPSVSSPSSSQLSEVFFRILAAWKAAQQRAQFIDEVGRTKRAKSQRTKKRKESRHSIPPPPLPQSLPLPLPKQKDVIVDSFDGVCAAVEGLSRELAGQLLQSKSMPQHVPSYPREEDPCSRCGSVRVEPKYLSPKRPRGSGAVEEGGFLAELRSEDLGVFLTEHKKGSACAAVALEAVPSKGAVSLLAELLSALLLFFTPVKKQSWVKSWRRGGTLTSLNTSLRDSHDEVIDFNDPRLSPSRRARLQYGISQWITNNIFMRAIKRTKAYRFAGRVVWRYVPFVKGAFAWYERARDAVDNKVAAVRGWIAGWLEYIGVRTTAVSDFFAKRFDRVRRAVGRSFAKTTLFLSFLVHPPNPIDEQKFYQDIAASMQRAARGEAAQDPDSYSNEIDFDAYTESTEFSLESDLPDAPLWPENDDAAARRIGRCHDKMGATNRLLAEVEDNLVAINGEDTSWLLDRSQHNASDDSIDTAKILKSGVINTLRARMDAVSRKKQDNVARMLDNDAVACVATQTPGGKVRAVPLTSLPKGGRPAKVLKRRKMAVHPMQVTSDGVVGRLAGMVGYCAWPWWFEEEESFLDTLSESSEEDGVYVDPEDTPTVHSLDPLSYKEETAFESLVGHDVVPSDPVRRQLRKRRNRQLYATVCGNALAEETPGSVDLTPPRDTSMQSMEYLG